MKQQIIAHGGGGFSAQTPALLIEKYILAQTAKPNPRICFLPQASSESQEYVAKFYETFCALGAHPSWVSLFGRVESGWQEKLLNQDIIYVGGGNTKSMLALWREWGVDVILEQAYRKGIVLAGVSAGAICWFEQGITDSVWPIGVVKALGFLPGTLCPHFDSESERQDIFRNSVNNEDIPPGIALEDHTAVHFINGKLHKAISARPDKQVVLIGKDKEEILYPVTLGSDPLIR